MKPQPVTMLTPDFPFPYDEYLQHPSGLGSVPPSTHGTEVAVIGAGLAGLVAALELMKMGLRPVIYESGTIGGRLRGATLPGADAPVADMGGMRFPVSSRAFWHYADLAGVGSAPFPNPLDSASPSTVVELGGQQFYASASEALPPFFQEVADAWEQCLEERAEYAAMQQAIADRDYATIKRIWAGLVPVLDDTSFSNYLASSKAFSALPYQYREAFGQIGFGSGGWDVSFPNAILEILRVVYMECENNQRRILGGARGITDGLWSHTSEKMEYWPEGTSLASLHGGMPRGAVTSIRRAAGPTDPAVTITDAEGSREYAAAIVTCHKWLLSTEIQADESLFSPEQWMAMRRIHYLQSSKTFVVVDRPFWLDTDPDTGRRVMSTTLTDRVTRGTYLFDNGPDQQALICLSYTWNDDALKWLPLTAQQRADVMLRTLGEIYPDVDIRSHIVGQPLTVSWEDEPGFAGAFKINLPGHYRYQRRLYTQFMEHAQGGQAQGIYLAGDDVSWTAGWAEGAVTTALNATWAVMDQLGGHCTPENPGPGDRFTELAPVVLPEASALPTSFTIPV
ncbi:NAD(P)/FAD-dependent oxidoreductase [Arthrobacter sp. NtRootA1]|uniref:flavin monoamine oxidase family protein n=1 Tax=Arthrobacter sp. NtRootA1 TaxID=2830983 RepID=UPI001CC7E997|nr:NAD(P)/FAD-dependent oxidoreductase [Arthrobacter sp. NtRootA1]BCW05989.1 amine oxidase [Arthrobacter sp. NtRootA1]